MRRPLWNGFRVALLVAGATALSAAPAQAKPPGTVYVDPAGSCHKKAPCFTTIQAAIDASAPGTVILAQAGTYHEHVVLDRALVLGGQGAVLDGDGAGTALTIATSGAIVTRLDLRDADVGVGLDSASGNQIDSLRISDVGRGMLFRWGSQNNTVTRVGIDRATLYGVDTGDTGNASNSFMLLRVRDSGTGFNAYAGSDSLVLADSQLTGNVTGVAIGWSGGWTVRHNEITGNQTGVLTDTVWSGAITHNYVAHNTDSGITEGGFGSTFVAQDNRIEANGLSGVTLCNQAQGVELHHNMVLGNARYGVEVCDGGGANRVTGNYLFGDSTALGNALDDQGSNTWAGNYYSLDPTGVAPYTIPGTAGAQDATPLSSADLPTPTAKADCRNDGWWLLTDGTLPFRDQRACERFVK